MSRGKKDSEEVSGNVGYWLIQHRTLKNYPLWGFYYLKNKIQKIGKSCDLSLGALGENNVYLKAVSGTLTTGTGSAGIRPAPPT